jgi:hypothetical protein
MAAQQLAIYERGWLSLPETDESSDEVKNTWRGAASIFGIEVYREFVTLGKRLYVCSDGKFGSGPGEVEVGDVIVIIAGSRVPYILRPVDDGRVYKFVGWAYHEGVMWGEFFKEGVSAHVESFMII